MTPSDRLRVKKYRGTERGKAVYIKARKTWASKLRIDLIIKYGGCCICCGEANFKFLTIDHKKGKTLQEKALHSWSIYGRLRRTLDKNIQIMCWNCNCGRATNGGVCPHQEKGAQNGFS